MSRTIDERVVSMQFDNKHFENNVQTTLGTLDKLKKSLKLDGASKGLQNVGAAAKKCDLSPIGDSAQKVGLKFNALYTVADQAFRNMYNSAEAYAKKIVSAFTTDPIKAGFSEYELKMGSVQTIMAGTGESLETVNKYLEELNQYSDQTIYSFADMTSNIGKFTNAGVKLEDAVAAIKGISNVAALSGANANEASRAMYNFSQALSAGYVKLIDWKSIENANMATVGFKEQLIEMALEMGTIEKASNGMYKTLEGNTFNATKNFNEVFQDQWLTSEVLVKTLEQYADETTDIGAKATAAATEVKTFTMMMDTLKEGAQSGWAQTWELIIGDFDEAKELWTNVSNVLGEIIGDSSKKRNDLLEGALGSNWDRMEDQIVKAGGSVDVLNEKIREAMTNAGVDVDKLLEDFGSFEKAFKDGGADVKFLEDALNDMKKSVEGLNLSEVEVGLKDYSKGEGVKQLQTALTELGYELPKWGIDGIFHTETKNAVKAFQKAQGLKITGIVDEATLEALKEATSETEALDINVEELTKDITKLGGRELLLKSFGNIFKAIREPLVAIGAAWNNVMGSMDSGTLYNIIEGFEKFTSNLILTPESLDQLARGFKGVFAVLKVVGSFISGGFKMAFNLLNKVLESFDMNILEAFGWLGDMLLKFEDWVKRNDYVAKSINWLSDKIVDGTKAVKGWIEEFWNLPKVQKFVNKFKDACKDLYKNAGTYAKQAAVSVKDFFVTLYKSEKVQGFLIEFKDKFADVFSNIKERLSGLIDAFKSFFKNLRSGTSFKDAFASFKDSVVDYFSNIDYKAIAKNILSKIGTFIKNLVVNIVSIGKSVFGAIGTFLKNAWGAFEGIGKFIKENIGSIVALASIVLLLSTLRKIKMAVELIAGPLDAIQDALTGLTQAAKRAATAALIKSLGITIGIIAASIAVLAQIPSKDLWGAVGAIAAIAAILGILTFTMSKVVKDLNTKDTAALSAYLLSIGGAMILMALTAKIMGNMNEEQWKRGMGAVAAFIGMMAVMALAVKRVDHDVSKFGTMMLKISASLIILAIAMKMFAKMDGDVILKGGGVIIGFLTVMTFMMKSTNKIGSDADKFGKMMLSIGASFIFMAIAIKMLGKMDTKELIQGGIAMGALMLIVGLMTKMTKIGPKDKSGAYSFGKMMSSIGVALLLMSTSILILGKMDTKTLIQGGIAVGVLMGVMVAIMEATKVLGKNTKDLGKVGTMMMGFGVSLLLIAGAVALLGMLDGDKLAKGLIAIAVIGGVMTALVAVSKNLQNVKMGPIIGMSIMLGVVAASVVALSMIPAEKLAAATAAMGVLVLSLAALMKRMSGMQGMTGKSLIFIGAAVLIVAGIGYLIKYLTDNIKDPKGALMIAIGVSALMLVMTGMFKAISKVAASANRIKGGNIVAAAGLLLLVGGLVVGLAALAINSMPKIAEQLSAFMTKLDGFISGAKKIDESTLNAIKTLAEVMLIMSTASIKYGISKMFGADTLTAFSTFIANAIPVVQEMATEISDDDVDIDYEKVQKIVDIVKNLAEAASNVPTTIAGGIATPFGAAGLAIIPQLEQFTDFVTQVVPVVKDLAVAVSAKNFTINQSAVNAVIDIVSALSDAAANAPSIEVDVAGARMGAYASVNVPLLGKFKTFIVESAKELKGFVASLDGVEVDSETIKGICDIVGALGTAASGMPAWTASVGFGKVGTMIGIMGGAEVPMLGQFKTFISSSMAAIGEFSNALNNTSGTGTSYDITEDKIKIIKDVCDIVGMLGTAAKDVPTAEVFADIKAAGGRMAGKFFGVSTTAGAKWPAFDSTVKFFKAACNAVKDLVLDPQLPTSTIEESDVATLQAICGCVKILSEAAGSVPEATVFAGIGGAGGKIGTAIAAGTFAISGESWPDLDNTIKFFKAVVPLIPDMVKPASGSELTAEDTENLKSIATAVKVLCEGAGALDSDGTVTMAGALANVSNAGFTAGAVVGSVTWEDNFKDAAVFFETVGPIMSKWTTEVKASKLTEADTENLKSIATATKVLCEGAGALGSDSSGWAAGLALVGSIPVLMGGKAKTKERFKKAKQFFDDVAPIMTEWAVEVKAAGLDEDDRENLIGIANAVDILCAAAGKAPTKTEAASLLAFTYYSCEAQLTDMATWLQEVSETMTGWMKDVQAADFEESDLTNITKICTAVKTLSEAADDVPDKETFVSAWGVKVTAADFDGMIEWLIGDGKGGKGMKAVIEEFNTYAKESLVWDDQSYVTLKQIGTIITQLSEASASIPQAEEMTSWLSKFETETEFGPFNEWVAGLGTAISKMDTNLGTIDTEQVTAASEAIKNIANSVDYMWDALGDFKLSGGEPTDALEILSEYLVGTDDEHGIVHIIKGLQDELASFEVDTDLMSKTSKALSDITDSIKIIEEVNYDKVNIPAFETAVEDTAEAINTFVSTVTDPETVSTTCNTIQKIVDLFTNMVDIKYDSIVGFNNGLDLFDNSASISGFVAAFTNDNLGAARTNLNNLINDFVTLKDKGISRETSDALASALLGLAGAGISDFIDAFETASGEEGSVITAVEGLVNAAKSAAGSQDMIDKFTGVGENLSAGLAKGISNKVDSIANAAAAVVRAAITAAEEEGGIESPSKVFRQIGYYLDEGLALGIDGMSHVVARSAVNVADTAIEGTKSVISRLASAIDSDIDTQPTIRPVLDLSDVSSGASTINGMFGMSPSIRTLSNVGYLSASVTNRQNGSNSDVISAIEKLGSKLGKTGPTYQFGDISYDNDSALNNAVGQLVRAVRVERRK